MSGPELFAWSLGALTFALLFLSIVVPPDPDPPRLELPRARRRTRRRWWRR